MKDDLTVTTSIDVLEKLRESNIDEIKEHAQRLRDLADILDSVSDSIKITNMLINAINKEESNEEN